MNIVKRCLLLCCATMLLTGCFKIQHDHNNNYKVPFQRTSGVVPYAVSDVTNTLFGANTIAAQMISRSPDNWLGFGMGYSYETLLVRLSVMGIDVQRFGDNVVLVLASDNFFKLDSADLRPYYFDQLVDVAALVQQYSVGDIIISSYADDIGSKDYNRNLTFQQAQTLLGYLWAHGVDQHRIHAFGHGSSFDVAENISPTGAAFNRRIELHLKVRI